jgi:uncharacterized short protein YbdD (DUF466 family)
MASLREIRYWVREFFGENDYARYVAEWRAAHGGIEPAAADPAAGHRLLTEREFFADRCRLKYGTGVQRCC